jgi:large subunit ribosomal protein L18
LKGRVADAYRLGMALAEIAAEMGIKRAVFDRNGLRYHGRVRAVAEGARKGGLDL